MNYKNVFAKAKELGIEELELYVAKHTKLSLELFHKKVETYTIADGEVISARGIVNGKMGVASTEDLNDYESLLNEVVANSKVIEEKKVPVIYAGDKSYKKLKVDEKVFDKYSVADKINLLLEGEKKAFEYDSKIVEVDGVTYEEEFSKVDIINSKGLKLSNKNVNAVYVVSVVASDGKDTRTGYSYKLLSDLSELNVDEVVKDACDTAINKIGGTPCKSNKYKIVLSNNVMNSLIRILLSAVNGEAVNRGQSILKGKLDTQIASTKFTLVENPHSKEYPYFFRGFDDEGVATTSKKIIDKGVLKTYLYDIDSANQAGVKSTGNGFKQGGGQIGVGTTFVELKPGKKTIDELLAKVKKGVMICDVQGLHAGINPISGDFSLQASGFEIKEGKKGAPINLITIAGNLYTMLTDIVEVASDSFVSFGGIKSPSVYVKSLAISGK